MGYSSSRPYPYLPVGRTLLYVLAENPFIARGQQISQPIRDRYPEAIITASVIVRGGQVIGEGVNNPVHTSFCPRTVFQCPSGEGYELCPRHCHSDSHSEASAIRAARERGELTEGADLYLYGHWWSCRPCWEKMIAAGIRDVYLVEGATEAFYQPSAGKGEPAHSLVVATPSIGFSNLPELLTRVNIRLVEQSQQGEADYFFIPTDPSTREGFVMELSRVLEESGLYSVPSV